MKKIKKVSSKENWIPMEDWDKMSHSQYRETFFVCELLYEVGYMGKHIVCQLDEDDNFHVDCDWAHILRKEIIAAILPFSAYYENKKL